MVKVIGWPSAATKSVRGPNTLICRRWVSRPFWWFVITTSCRMLALTNDLQRRDEARRVKRTTRGARVELMGRQNNHRCGSTRDSDKRVSVRRRGSLWGGPCGERDGDPALRLIQIHHLDLAHVAPAAAGADGELLRGVGLVQLVVGVEADGGDEHLFLEADVHQVRLRAVRLPVRAIAPVSQQVNACDGR